LLALKDTCTNKEYKYSMATQVHENSTHTCAYIRRGKKKETDLSCSLSSFGVF